MDKLKAGDLITVQTENIRSQYSESGDFDTLVIDSHENSVDMGGFEEMSKKHIYKIVKNDLHKDLAKYGVNVGHYTLESIKVEHAAWPVEGEVRINGEHDIPFKTSRKTKLYKTYFFSDVRARAIATALNMEERDKMAELKKAVENAVVMLDQIVDKAHV